MGPEMRVRAGIGTRRPAAPSCRRAAAGTARPTRVRTAAPTAGAPTVSRRDAAPIEVSEAARAHLEYLRSRKGGGELLLRMGVRSGGCSGMSYVMDFDEPANIAPDDSVFETETKGLRLVCDAKSLLYLFGMRLDFSDALVGGGFQFHNPNAEKTCGCGKSFGT